MRAKRAAVLAAGLLSAAAGLAGGAYVLYGPLIRTGPGPGRTYGLLEDDQAGQAAFLVLGSLVGLTILVALSAVLWSAGARQIGRWAVMSTAVALGAATFVTSITIGWIFWLAALFAWAAVAIILREEASREPA